MQTLINSIKKSKLHPFRTLRFTIAFAFTVTTVGAMLFIGIILFGEFTSTAEKNAAQYTYQLMEQVNTNLDSYLRNMMNILEAISYKEIRNQELNTVRLEESMNLISISSRDIVSIALFDSFGDIITSAPFYRIKQTANVPEQSWFINAKNKSSNMHFSTPHVQNLFERQYNWVISLSQSVDITKRRRIQYGVLVLDMNISSIDQMCKRVNLGKSGYVYIIDSNGEIIYHPKQQLIYSGVQNERNYEMVNYPDGSYIEKNKEGSTLISIKTTGYTGWKIVGVSNLNEIVSRTRETQIIFFGTFLAGISMATFITMYMSARITNPLKQLENSMKVLEEGEFDTKVDIKGNDEIAHLSNAFNTMVTRMKYLMDEVVKEQEQKRKSELDALNAQINPHFLYNTLDSIVWMMENERVDEAITMVTALARLFRLSLSKGRQIITIGEEIEHAKNYLLIQKMRYKNKFKYCITTDPDIINLTTLKLIIQPLVENALYHGIEHMLDEGVISITTSVVNKKILIEVADNGIGIPEEIKDTLLIDFEDTNIYNMSTQNKGSGIGLKNVHKRVQLYYGADYGLEIESEPDVGTRIKIWLPIIDK